MSKRKSQIPDHQKAGLRFPINGARLAVKSQDSGTRVGSKPLVMMTAVTEYLVSEALNVAGDYVRKEGLAEIEPKHTKKAIRWDREMNQVFHNVIISGVASMVQPFIPPFLLGKGKKNSKKSGTSATASASRTSADEESSEEEASSPMPGPSSDLTLKPRSCKKSPLKSPTNTKFAGRTPAAPFNGGRSGLRSSSASASCSSSSLTSGATVTLSPRVTLLKATTGYSPFIGEFDQTLYETRVEEEEDQTEESADDEEEEEEPSKPRGPEGTFGASESYIDFESRSYLEDSDNDENSFVRDRAQTSVEDYDSEDENEEPKRRRTL